MERSLPEDEAGEARHAIAYEDGGVGEEECVDDRQPRVDVCDVVLRA